MVFCVPNYIPIVHWRTQQQSIKQFFDKLKVYLKILHLSKINIRYLMQIIVLSNNHLDHSLDGQFVKNTDFSPYSQYSDVLELRLVSSNQAF